jgi:hypothetical protein
LEPDIRCPTDAYVATLCPRERRGEPWNVRPFAPHLSPDGVEPLARDERFLDPRTRNFVNEYRSYRVLVTSNGTDVGPLRLE